MGFGSLHSYYIGHWSVNDYRGPEAANYGITHKPIYLNKT